MDTLFESAWVEFVRYNKWANQQLMTVCLNLSEGQISAPIPGAYGSLQVTFGHLLAAEADYIRRITGAGPQPPFRWEDGPSLAEMAAFAEQVGDAFIELIPRVPPTQIVHEQEGTQFMDYQALVLFMQVINHGIEHRTNITTYLATLGVSVPEIDTWGYLFAHGDRFELKHGE